MRKVNSKIRARVIAYEKSQPKRLPFDTEDFTWLDAEMQTVFFDYEADINGIKREQKLLRRRRKLTFPTSRFVDRC